jgi:small-conductance mechanosensitive channel
MKIRALLLVILAAVAVLFLRLAHYGVALYTLSQGRTLASFLGFAAVVAAAYEAIFLLIAAIVKWRKGAPSEVAMLGALFRAAGVFAVLMAVLWFLGIALQWAAIGGFAGLLMGWSLQAPVSGLAAWVFVNVKRPFRVGDRVLIPAWGLIGDVKQIGMMYTVLNQVGGTVGSEEAAGRDVLIPNAMLFTNIVINYTPKQSAAFVLDEVVIRITFDSDWSLAERVLMDAAREVTGDIIQQTGQQPYIRADMYDYGVYLRLRYTTLAMDRPRIAYEITRLVFNEFQKYPSVDFAIPYVYSYRTGVRAGARHLEAAPALEAGPIEIELEKLSDLTDAAVRPENGLQISELARRIGEMGLLQPIVVEKRNDGRYNVVAGQLRLAACRALGWKTIPAVVKLS